MNNKSPPFVSYAGLPVASNVRTTLMPKSGLSTAIIFKSSVVGPGVPPGTPGVCGPTTGEEDCCWAGRLPDSAAVAQIGPQRPAAAPANRPNATTAKRRYVH